MVANLRVNVNSVLRELDVAMKVLTEARVVSRYRRIFKGKGLDFEDFREYTPSDDASEIDWKASVRSKDLLIRRYKEERDMNVFFMVDVSTSMLFGSTPKLKHEFAAELVAALSHFVMESGDRIGLVMFTDQVVRYIEPGKGQAHYYMFLRNLLTPNPYGGKYELGGALRFLRNTADERSMVFIVSDFIGLEPGWDQTVRNVAGLLDGVAVMVRDPRDESLPSKAGQIVISDPYSARELLIDCGDYSRIGYENYSRETEKAVTESFKEASWDLLKLSTQESFILPVISYLKRREILFR